jgi:hypothetical protein
VESGTTPAGYHLIARYEIGGTESGYDYLHVDTANRRLFVAHRTKVEVLNVDSGTRLGQLEGLRGVHGVEIVKSPSQAFATNGLDRTVTVFDPVTLKRNTGTARAYSTGLFRDSGVRSLGNVSAETHI